jgi:hypothetical protein
MRSLILSTALLAAFSVSGCGNDTTDTGQPLGRKLPPNGIDILVGAQNKGTGAFTPNPLTISLANGGWSSGSMMTRPRAPMGATG